MRLPARFCLSSLFLLFSFGALAQGPQVIAGDILVMMEPGASAAVVARDLGLIYGEPTEMRVVREVSAPLRTWLLHFDPSRIEQAEVLRAARKHPAVRLAQNNHRVELRNVPNDTDYSDQWHHQNIGSEVAWDISTGGLTTDGDTIVVCIIENSNLPHPDLIANAWYNHAEIPNNDIDDDGNGFVDDFRGWSPNDMDDEVYGGGHGTQVAGMVGATGNNELGVTGANWSVKMMIVSNSGASDEGVLASHTYPLVMRQRYNASNGTEGAFVVATNASWGINGGQPADAPIWCAMYDSLGAAGVLNCGATTNANQNVDVIGDLPTGCPSDYMISVTATDEDDIRSFSGYGLTSVDVGAPGDDVYTTNINGGYGTTSGTSFASPLTAGVIGLLYSAPCQTMMDLVKDNPRIGALYIRQMLFDGVDVVDDLVGRTVTGGRINSGNSMQRIMELCGTCPAPYDLHATVSGTTTTLDWGAIGGTTFDVRYRALGASEWVEVNGLGSSTYELQGLAICSPYEFQVRVHCEEEVSEFSPSRSWTSSGCCTAPAGLTVLSNDPSSVMISWESVPGVVTYDVRFAPLGSSTWTVIPELTEGSITIEPLEPCTNYRVEVMSHCDSLSSDWSTALTAVTAGCGSCVDLPYCASVSADPSSEWIQRVRIGTIDNATGSDEGYGNYTDLSTDLAVGTRYAFRLEPGFVGFQFSEWFRIWIDLDRDGEFALMDELVYDTEGRSTQAVEDSLLIPEGTSFGPTRMRVVMRYNAPPDSPCEDLYDYGETEDYCVNLVENDDTGIGENELLQLTLYPQPADDVLHVRVPATGLLNDPYMQVHDAQGRLVGDFALRRGPFQLATASLPDGLYSYRLTSDERVVAVGRFMVVHGR